MPAILLSNRIVNLNARLVGLISIWLAVLATVVGLGAVPASSQTVWGEEQKLGASDAVAGIGFGDSGALGDGIAVIGASANGLANLSAGAAYVIEWNAADLVWEETRKLEAGDGELDDRFGWSVSISGDLIVVGAPEDDTETGSAYVFRRDGDEWQEEQKLTASDRAEGDRFGISVSVFGDVIVVGAPEAEGPGGPTGAAYVYRFEGGGWVEEQKLQVGSFATIADFGASVAAGDGRLIVGVPDAGPGAQNLGAAYVFRWNPADAEWVVEQELSASDEDPQDKFGERVAMTGDIALIGVPQDEDGGPAAGAAYIFRRTDTTWVEEQKLVASDASESDRFGLAVGLTDVIAIVGALDADTDGGNGAGAAYVYEFDGSGWTESQILGASDAGIGDHFGESVAAFGDRLLIGASNADDGGESAGSAYIFKQGLVNAVEEVPDVEAGFQVEAFPNPFSGFTTLAIELDRPGRVGVAVFDVLGREVLSVGRDEFASGLQEFRVDMSHLPAGLFIARVEVDGRAAVKRLLLVE